MAGRDTLQFSISCIFWQLWEGICHLKSPASCSVMEVDMPLHALADMAFPAAASGSCKAGLSNSGVLLHTRRATFQQLPELTPHIIEFFQVFISSSLLPSQISQRLCTGKGQSPTRNRNIQGQLPTSGCTFSLPCSLCDKGRNTSVPLICAYIIETVHLVKGSNLHTRWDIQPGLSSKSIHNT